MSQINFQFHEKFATFATNFGIEWFIQCFDKKGIRSNSGTVPAAVSSKSN
jgi:hypothetical protein